MGLDTVVAITRPEGLVLDYTTSGPPSDNRVSALDRFGRVEREAWTAPDGTSQTRTALDSFQYTYNGNSTVITRENRLNPEFSEVYTYDAAIKVMNVLERGTVDGAQVKPLVNVNGVLQRDSFAWRDGKVVNLGWQTAGVEGAALYSRYPSTEGFFTHEDIGPNGGPKGDSVPLYTWKVQKNCWSDPVLVANLDKDGKRIVSQEFTYDPTGRLTGNSIKSGEGAGLVSGNSNQQFTVDLEGWPLVIKASGLGMASQKVYWSPVCPGMISQIRQAGDGGAEWLAPLQDVQGNVTALVQHTGGGWQVKSRYIYGAAGPVKLNCSRVLSTGNRAWPMRRTRARS